MKTTELFVSHEQYQKDLCKINQIVLLNPGIGSLEASKNIVSAINNLEAAKAEAYSWIKFKSKAKDYDLKTRKLYKPAVDDDLKPEVVATTVISMINKIIPQLGKLDGKTPKHLTVISHSLKKHKLTPKFIKSLASAISDLNKASQHFQDVLGPKKETVKKKVIAKKVITKKVVKKTVVKKVVAKKTAAKKSTPKKKTSKKKK